MRTLTLHIELFVHHSLLFRLYNLLCRTAQHAQPFVPKVNLICTNIFMCKVLRKNNFSSNHSTSKNLITKIQNYLKMSSEKDVAYIQPSKRTVGFTLLQINKTLLYNFCCGKVICCYISQIKWIGIFFYKKQFHFSIVWQNPECCWQPSKKNIMECIRKTFIVMCVFNCFLTML